MGKTKAWKIVLVGTFAEDYLVDIARHLVMKAAEKKDSEAALIADIDNDILVWKRSETDFDIPSGEEKTCLFDFCTGDNGEKISHWDYYYKVLPLFICEKIDELRKCGLKCPYEFVIERKDLFDGNHYKATDILARRIDILKSQKQSENGVSLKTFRDWMSGVMRKYLFLDDVAHGTSGFIDAEDPNWDWSSDDKKYKWIERDDNDDAKHKYSNHGQWLKDRFAVNSTANNGDPLRYLRPIMQALWGEYFDAGNLSLQVLSNEENITSKIDRLTNVYNKPYENPLPLSHGDRARFVTPTGKIHVLLIDDDAKESVLLNKKIYNEIHKSVQGKEQTYDMAAEDDGQDNQWSTMVREQALVRIKDEDKAAYKESWNRFDSVFTVQPFELKPDDFPKFERRLNEILKAHLSYDFALVDLCFGEDPGQDPLGYHVIKKLAKLFPHMPIVVYSRYKDMGHIARAFQCGAMWFLQKGEEQKLARHLMDLVKRGSWKSEWRAMQEYNPVEFIYTGKNPAFDDKFERTEKWKYLTAKSLEFFPGKFIEVKKMGGGISTAVTFSVQKGLKLDGNPLQSPTIIKIDTAANTRMEYERYFRYIRPYIANESGRIEKPCIIIERKCSAIVYTFAGRQDNAHTLDSMKSMIKADIVFKASCDYEKYRKAFDMIFDEILPRIHRVTPNREFGDGDENCHQEVFSRPEALDAQKAKGAAFPNLQFGEVEEKDFYQTYLIRFPHFGKIDLSGAAFDEQPQFTQKGEKEDGEIDFANISNKLSKLHPYEFHDTWPNDEGGIDLEVYDYVDDRKPYLLTGAIATHVARFRQQLYPGATLWVRRGAQSSKTEEDAALFEKRLGSSEDNFAWKKYVWHYSQADSWIGAAGKAYFCLVERVLNFCRALKECETNLNINNDEKVNRVKPIYQKYLSSKHLFDVTETQEFFKHIRERFKCPVAICHGDLNYGNIMLESRKHPPKDEKPDVSQTVTDAWLIDFARTRRDLIAHDFNVMFTDTFALLFDVRLFEADKHIKEDKDKYETHLTAILPRFIHDVMFAKNPNPPDYLEGDKRFEFVYKILRRIRKAALGAGISEEMYTLTTVLECLMALKLHLKKNMKNIRASAALFAVAKICFDHLCDDVELDLLSMDKDGKTNKQ